MAPRAALVVAFFRLSSADLEEMSMLQMPVAAHDFGEETDTSKCECPGYEEDKCRAHAAEGCIWSSEQPDKADSPWCQCDPDFVYDPVANGPIYQDYLPTTSPDEGTTTAATVAAVVETTAAAVETTTAAIETTAAEVVETTAAAVETTTPVALTTLPASGFFRLQQKSTMRFLDAYETLGDGYTAMTREAEDNPSQWWFLQSSSDVTNQVYTIQHVGNNDATANGRFVDADEVRRGYGIRTRLEERNDSQRWHFISIAANTYTITQVGFNDGDASGRFFDASSVDDYRCMTELQSEAEQPESQQWVLTMLTGDEADQARALRQLFPASEA